MKTKKFLSMVLASIMMLSMATTSFAADISTDGASQDVTVTYGTSQSFVVTIPSSINLNEEGRGGESLTASNVMIPANAVLEISISGNDYVDGWELIDVSEPTNKISYTIQEDTNCTEVYSGDVVLSVKSGEAYDSVASQYLRFWLNEEITKAGTYTDTLTFNVDVIVKELISFNINAYGDKEYVFQALEGMTWREFINSGLTMQNSFYDIENSVYFNDKELNSSAELDDVPVYLDDIIDPNLYYYTYNR